MEKIIVIVGFLGAGKTTFLKRLTRDCLNRGQSPYILINDYENANLDAQQFSEYLDQKQIEALSGSCICCDGITQLRMAVNSIPHRTNGITLIEANGTTDACELMGFMAVGIDSRYLPPIQVSLVDVRMWQNRGLHNELEANQIQVSSQIILNHPDKVSSDRLSEVKAQIRSLNPSAALIEWEDFDFNNLVASEPHPAKPQKMDHHKSHWSACSANLPSSMKSEDLHKILQEIPETILRVKGCTQLDDDPYFSFFERIASGETFVRPYRGKLADGPKLLVIGPGSEPNQLEAIIKKYT